MYLLSANNFFYDKFSYSKFYLQIHPSRKYVTLDTEPHFYVCEISIMKTRPYGQHDIRSRRVHCMCVCTSMYKYIQHIFYNKFLSYYNCTWYIQHDLVPRECSASSGAELCRTVAHVCHPPINILYLNYCCSQFAFHHVITQITVSHLVSNIVCFIMKNSTTSDQG